jgi:Co/Zn/Cd efflux system component
MSIDVFTYASNLYAECLKDSELSTMKKIMSQIVIPTFSVTCLLAVTVWVAIDAYLRLGRHKNVNVGLNLMYIFAAVNICVDVCCGLLFLARRNNVFSETVSRKISVVQDSHDTDWSNHSDADEGINMIQLRSVENMQLVRGAPTDDGTTVHVGEERPNLNMMSAFTHIGGDTLRTLAIFGAALVSSVFGVDPQISDAWAGIAVAITIVIAVTPLVFSVKKSIQAVMLAS